VHAPRVGTGTTLLDITAAAPMRKLYGVELDARRARSAAGQGIETIHGDCEDVDGAGYMSMVYCNPPYGNEAATDRKSRRQEVAFLDNATSWLAPGGLLVFVVPHYTLADCAQIFATKYSWVQMLLLTDPEARKYKQVVVFAVRGEYTYNTNYQIREAMYAASNQPKGLETLAKAVERGDKYLVKPATPVTMRYTGMPVDEVEDLLPGSKAYKLMAPYLVPPDDVGIKRPLIPLNAGHVGLLCTAGRMNGIFGEGERRHSARWLITKVTVNIPQTPEDKEKDQIRTTERFDTSVNVLFADGRYQLLSQKNDGPGQTDLCEVGASLADSEEEDVMADSDDGDEEEEIYG